MTIGNMCRDQVVTIVEAASIKDAAKVMAEKNIGFLVVTGADGNKPVGSLTDRDIVVNGIAGKGEVTNLKVSDIMHKDLLVLKGEQGVREIIKDMCEKGVRRAPIVENEKLTGIVSIDDLLVLLAKELNEVAELIKKQIT
ncbi:MAG: CBS domain-containing protein [Burkholderiales bacterium]